MIDFDDAMFWAGWQLSEEINGYSIYEEQYRNNIEIQRVINDIHRVWCDALDKRIMDILKQQGEQR